MPVENYYHYKKNVQRNFALFYSLDVKNDTISNKHGFLFMLRLNQSISQIVVHGMIKSKLMITNLSISNFIAFLDFSLTLLKVEPVINLFCHLNTKILNDSYLSTSNRTCTIGYFLFWTWNMLIFSIEQTVVYFWYLDTAEYLKHIHFACHSTKAGKTQDNKNDNSVYFLLFVPTNLLSKSTTAVFANFSEIYMCLLSCQVIKIHKKSNGGRMENGNYFFA